jgi:hypothetical protein
MPYCYTANDHENARSALECPSTDGHSKVPSAQVSSHGVRTKRYVRLGTCGRILERQTISQFGLQNAYMSVWEGEYGHFVAMIPERK